MAASRLAVLITAAVLAIGCAGNESSGSAETAYRAFAEAASARNTGGVWELLSQRNRRAASRTLFDAAARGLERDYDPVVGGTVVLNAGLEDGARVVTLRGDKGRPSATAAILREEDGAWKVQLSELDLGFGDHPLDVTVNVDAGPQEIQVRAWVGDRETVVQPADPTYAPTFTVGVPEDLPQGIHAVTAVARARGKTGAIGWLYEHESAR